MRISDLFKLAAKTVKGRWAALPALGIAIGIFCMCFAGAAITAVQQEKLLPCEISIIPDSKKITDSSVAEVMKIPNVTAATAVLTVPATIKTGEYTAELTLTGIAQGYIEGVFSEGSVFPDSSVMPYIVLSYDACKEFKNEDNGESFYFMEEDESNADKLPDIDWLGSEFSVIAGGSEKPVISSVCGILADKGEECEQQPKAYISIFSAKDLLQKSGQSTEYTGASVRITNTGHAEDVADDIAALGLEASGTNTQQQQKWELKMKEATYLLMAGAFSVLCSAVLMAAWKRIFVLERNEALTMFAWIGMKKRNIRSLFVMQGAIVTLPGIAAGITAVTALPSFLPVELAQESVFMLPVPFEIIAASMAISIASGIPAALSRAGQKRC